jgi:phosphate/phosphite/phosphonate ABC transporter binding protein
MRTSSGLAGTTSGRKAFRFLSRKWTYAMLRGKKIFLLMAMMGASLVLAAVHVHAQDNATAAAKGDMPVAFLPMYEESDAVKKADDVFWSHLQAKLKAEGVDAPAALTRSDNDLVKQWEAPNVLLSQACGYPYVHILMGQGVKVIGTPVYTTNRGLPKGEYRSVIIVKADSPYRSLADLKGKKAGVNDMGSNSGMNAFRNAVAAAFPEQDLKQGIFSSVIVTGGHLNSIRMVGAGQIDVASIDSVSYDLMKRDHPDLVAKTRILSYTVPSPGLPMITGAQTDDATIAKIRAAIKDMVTNPSDDELRQALATMKLDDFVVIDQKTYHQRINQLEQTAVDKGYPVLK